MVADVVVNVYVADGANLKLDARDPDLGAIN
jgi:hypothetical protein